MLMGQPETQQNSVQASLQSALNQPQVFYEDLTPEQRAQFYKNILNVR